MGAMQMHTRVRRFLFVVVVGGRHLCAVCYDYTRKYKSGEAPRAIFFLHQQTHPEQIFS
jgi:hypothetical protein